MTFQYLIQETLREDSNNEKRAKTLCPMSDVRTVALLFDACDYEQVLPFIRGLEGQGKQVRSWSYDAKYRPTYDRSYTMFVLNSRHFNRHGLLHGWVINDFSYFEPQLLVDLSRRENVVTDYLAALSKAPFKLGLKTSVPQRYDLICDIRQTDRTVLHSGQELLRYYEAISPRQQCQDRTGSRNLF